MRLRVALLSIAMVLCPVMGKAQRVYFGVKLGVPITSMATATDAMASSTVRFTVGPALSVNLPHHFAVDAALLYKQFDSGFGSDPARITVHRLELPLMLRYSFRGRHVRPFIHGGVSFNRVIAVSGSTACDGNAGGGQGFYCIGGKTAGQMRHEHTYGPVLGAGVDFGWRALRLAPEIRVTRWVDRNFGTADSSMRSNLSQVELLLEVRF